jgi:hypothetical protein
MRALLAEHCNEKALALEADLEKHYVQQEELIKTLVLRYRLQVDKSPVLAQKWS